MTNKELAIALSAAKGELRFARTVADANSAYQAACRCKSQLKPFFCGSRSCESCYLTQDYNNQLRLIAFIDGGGKDEQK